MPSRQLPASALLYILEALIPYSEANLKLSFKPNLFFNDLEKISARKRQTLRNAYYLAQKQGLIELDQFNVPRLTDHGRTLVKPYKPSRLNKHVELMVIFDIPEGERYKRRHLRTLLKELSFKSVQKSVWVSRFDHRQYIRSEIKQYGLENYVLVYEVSRIKV